MRVKPSKWGGDAHPMPPPHVQLRIKEHTGRGFRLLETVVRKSHLPLRLERLQSSGIEVSAHRQPGPGALFVTCLLTPLYICSARNATLCAGS